MNAYHKQLVAEDDLVLTTQAESIRPGENIEALMQKMRIVAQRSKVPASGLAAPQVGVSKRVVFIDMGTNKYFMLNPRIISAASTTNLAKEGCLSYPGKEKVIARPDWIEVDYLSPNRSKNRRTLHTYEARVVCHEIDHLNGICRVGDNSPPDGELPVVSHPKRTTGKAAVAMLLACALGMGAFPEHRQD
jgi:peptide deformylase